MYPEPRASPVLIGSVGVEGALSGSLDRLLAVPLIGDGIVRAGVAALRRRPHSRDSLLATASCKPACSHMVPVPPTVQAAIGSDGLPIVGRSRRSFLVEQRALLGPGPRARRRAGAGVAVATAVVSGASDRLVPVSAARSLAVRVPDRPSS